jgi:hypothetical protein
MQDYEVRVLFHANREFRINLAFDLVEAFVSNAHFSALLIPAGSIIRNTDLQEFEAVHRTTIISHGDIDKIEVDDRFPVAKLADALGIEKL